MLREPIRYSHREGKERRKYWEGFEESDDDAKTQSLLPSTSSSSILSSTEKCHSIGLEPHCLINQQILFVSCLALPR